VNAEDLKAGQEVYVPFYKRFFTLSADPTPHRHSRNVVALHFDGLTQPEYRLRTADMLLKPTAGQPL
jgi:hypothetical protein